jgi:putative phage-type endonuclease
MKIYKDIEQGTPEWHQVKKLKFTASNATAVIANGKGLQTLVKEMLADYYSSGVFEAYSGKYKNEAMQRGNDMEETARNIYTLETGLKVEQVGFVEIDQYIGCSPDGLVGEDGLIEIKNHGDKEFLNLALTDKINSQYINQMQFQLYVTGRKWCDYFGFNPNFTPNFYMKRIYRDEALIEKIRLHLAEAKQILIKEKIKLDKIFEVA